MTSIDEHDPRAAALLKRVLTDPVDQGNSEDDIRNRILDAAREQFSSFGIRLSSMEDVARRANVARVTIYRRFPNKDALVEAVTLLEFRKYFDQFLVDIKAAPTVSDRVVLGFTSSLRAMRNNPVLGGLLLADPHILASSMIGDGGQMVSVVRQFVADQLRREQTAGHVGTGVDVDLVAEVMVRMSASFLAIPSSIVDVDDEGQMANLARWLLVPLLDGPA
ncbi:TetR/AcrR family transcriptional regulator [Gordonia sp. DT30]|uniref:TetR/AcrR family transcriptional regulator n=1 Tax=Gordonia sp. DT30 TaxID=3416546 RepID=UPI003CEEE3E4